MSEPTILEKVARALRDADAVWAARAYPEKSAEDIQRIVAEAATEMGYESMAFAAVKALLEPTTLEVQMRGAEAIALYNIETDGPAKPHDECKTPDDWMMRGANIAGRMVSGAEATAAFHAMITEILAETKAPS